MVGNADGTLFAHTVKFLEQHKLNQRCVSTNRNYNNTLSNNQYKIPIKSTVTTPYGKQGFKSLLNDDILSVLKISDFNLEGFQESKSGSSEKKIKGIFTDKNVVKTTRTPLRGFIDKLSQAYYMIGGGNIIKQKLLKKHENLGFKAAECKSVETVNKAKVSRFFDQRFKKKFCNKNESFMGISQNCQQISCYDQESKEEKELSEVNQVKQAKVKEIMQKHNQIFPFNPSSATNSENQGSKSKIVSRYDLLIKRAKLLQHSSTRQNNYGIFFPKTATNSQRNSETASALFSPQSHKISSTDTTKNVNLFQNAQETFFSNKTGGDYSGKNEKQSFKLVGDNIFSRKSSTMQTGRKIKNQKNFTYSATQNYQLSLQNRREDNMKNAQLIDFQNQQQIDSQFNTVADVTIQIPQIENIISQTILDDEIHLQEQEQPSWQVLKVTTKGLKQNLNTTHKYIPGQRDPQKEKQTENLSPMSNPSGFIQSKNKWKSNFTNLQVKSAMAQQNSYQSQFQKMRSQSPQSSFINQNYDQKVGDLQKHNQSNKSALNKQAVKEPLSSLANNSTKPSKSQFQTNTRAVSANHSPNLRKSKNPNRFRNSIFHNNKRMDNSDLSAWLTYTPLESQGNIIGEKSQGRVGTANASQIKVAGEMSLS
eukprot:403375472